ncbi:serine/threonine-protein kinase BLUS1-like isoform X1 [Raphanus sativus]|uniref:Serine/threonine-protein kinase BLUS1-like isoform X1 n=1 Tax=Raphanus sativus TaxID=3726 RepID=A0A9W3CDT3_RAPSA|nr:serine/threonine-protein kinase BLUS1-like isoform X1 [Raphanus sativus]
MVSRLRQVIQAFLSRRRRKKMASGGGGGGSSKEKKGFSVNPKDYKLMEEVGHGASAVVHLSIYLPTKEVIAIKCLDLDRCNSNLDDIRREAQTMSLIEHPNVIKSYCSFAVDHKLWVVMPFMAQGSCFHLMKAAYPDGFEEPAICSILKETLKALDYLHRHGHIHRDVKSGNILLDDTGEIKLGDFGVSACLFENGDRQRSRNTFVGTPCWMAPEIMQPGSGYDSKADIWSFGITALELAHGHAPFSKYPPMKVLLMTIQNAPPSLDYDRDKKFSKSFRDMVALCLVKDQTKRPTAEKLLKHSFFKNAKSPEICVKKLFADLPPLWTRVKDLQDKDADLAMKGLDQEAISQSEYQRGVSTWNFNIEDLKEQAASLNDDDILVEDREEDDFYGEQLHNKASNRALASPEDMNGKEKVSDTFSLTASPVEPATPSPKHGVPQAKAKTHESGGPQKGHVYARRAQSSRVEPSFMGALSLPKHASANSFSAPSKSPGGFRDSLADKSKANVVQTKGRFSVTSEYLDLARARPLRKSTSVSILESKMPIKELSSRPASPSPPSSPPFFMPQLQNLVLQTSKQQELIINLLKNLQATEAADGSQNGKLPLLPGGSDINGTLVEPISSERERLLLNTIAELQSRMKEVTEELEEEKSKHAQSCSSN